MKSPIAEPALRGAHLKSWRAWELACQLQASIERWLHTGGYSLERRATEATSEHEVYVRFASLPGEWSLLIGECVQNLRNSLDNMVFAVSTLTAGRLLSEEEARGLEYPIDGPRPLSERRAAAALGLLPDAVRDFVLKTQPSAGGDTIPYHESKLWLLHRMSIYDKHRVIPTALVSLDAVLTTVMVTDFACVTPLQPVTDGERLARFTTSGDLPPETTGISCVLGVVFDDSFGASIQGVEIVRVLKDLREHVQRIHNQMLALTDYDVEKPFT